MTKKKNEVIFFFFKEGTSGERKDWRTWGREGEEGRNPETAEKRQHRSSSHDRAGTAVKTKQSI